MIAQLDRAYVASRPGKALSRLLSYSLFEGRPITTRGRAINPLVFAVLRLSCSLPSPRSVHRPVFVIGTGRSGTTVLGKILSMHPALGFLNEPKAMWYLAHPEDDVIGNYTRGPARFELTAGDATPEAVRRARRMLGWYLTAVASSRALIKYPEFVFRVDFARAIFPDARFVLIVRNGYDTCRSIQQWSERLGTSEAGERHDWWGVDQRKWKLLTRELVQADAAFDGLGDTVSSLRVHEDMAAVEWILTMRRGLRVAREHPAHTCFLRYEDLLDRPRQELSALLESCDLAADEKMFSYAEHVLHPAPSHRPVEIHEALRPLFEETMQALGYGES